MRIFLFELSPRCTSLMRLKAEYTWSCYPNLFNFCWFVFFITLIILHPTFNLSRSIACLCAYNPIFPHLTGVCTPGILYQARNTNVVLLAPLGHLYP